jgi:predicted lipoprotein with Yx(FWY)xxD motif
VGRPDRRIPPRWVSAPGLPAVASSHRPPPEESSRRPSATDPVRVPALGNRMALGHGMGGFPARRLVGIVLAAIVFTVIGAVLSAQAARPTTPDTIAPPVAPLASPAAPAPTAPTPAAATSPPAPRARTDPALTVLDTRELGKVVVDAEGFTLYRFDGDKARDATCVDACASTWRPATVDPDARLDLEGVEAAAVGLVRRGDGSYQLTIDGWPLYRFVGDAKPGRSDGQGLGGSWFAISPAGTKAAPP